MPSMSGMAEARRLTRSYLESHFSGVIHAFYTPLDDLKSWPGDMRTFGNALMSAKLTCPRDCGRSLAFCTNDPDFCSNPCPSGLWSHRSNIQIECSIMLVRLIREGWMVFLRGMCDLSLQRR